MNNSFDLLGNIAWLWGSSPMHKDWSITTLTQHVIPAIENQQFVLLMRDGYPIAYCSWALLDLENEVKYVTNSAPLSVDDWVSGDRKWIIDWIAPFGDSDLLYKHMRQLFPQDLFRAIRVSTDKNKNVGRVMYAQGGKVKNAKEKFAQYENELAIALQKKKSIN
ncbi:toxin-activating lysine-acyltransferase [Psychrobacter sp. FDAARGOS_221]|uniref:toxin-activating lysine-acyltransferase n=1 Tax=Psychrobacter sp. FDAARGOS_221 TaxID=1975705 RepID=UPI000BB597EB|nr:toxin-activating lysine-acyltransferase [Psychrobacter sp. FDAARGOS_221]PNK61710.1 toxin-activating lysine-acyltransferase [Psychrobacter sp. FDAARGOS_221]